MQNMSLMKSIISKAFFTISVIILLCLSSIAQNGLQVSARLIVKKGDLQGSKAVSYTHLRAHETVLDLVCRLLLEKKNFHHTPDA